MVNMQVRNKTEETGQDSASLAVIKLKPIQGDIAFAIYDWCFSRFGNGSWDEQFSDFHKWGWYYECGSLVDGDPSHLIIQFKNSEDAIMFALTWSDCLS